MQGSFTCICNEGFTLSENFICEGELYLTCRYFTYLHLIIIVIHNIIFNFQTLMNVTLVCLTVYLKLCVRILLVPTDVCACRATLVMALYVKVRCYKIFMDGNTQKLYHYCSYT